MASQKLTEYERKRLENINRNEEMMAALKVQSKVASLAAISKRQSTKINYLSLPTVTNSEAGMVT
ncbi:WD repeat-containing protein 76-like protein [Corchorus olitorius]|uniref:WD repeat-containing protein 76-like protein n=1 Tax=Corchorus olitorius TaxID=93759 RepID=A0A1R3J818_9ROSI|nr:WD repeat-containing protein 76-like protein [Corchorus olitorius]